MSAWVVAAWMLVASPGASSDALGTPGAGEGASRAEGTGERASDEEVPGRTGSRPGASDGDAPGEDGSPQDEGSGEGGASGSAASPTVGDPTAPSGGASEPTDDTSGDGLAPPRAKATLLGPNPAYLGQLVQVEVQLWRDDRAEDKPAPFFPEVRVRGAISVLSANAPPPETRTEDGVPFLLQKRRYLVFPQSDGDLTIPPIPVSLPASDGTRLTVPTQALELHADVPPGAGGRLPLVARNVTVERTIDGDLDHLRVGDAFTVSLRVAADDTDVVLLPHLELPDIDGMSRYPGEATTDSSSDRGQYRAERTDHVTYVANRWGFFQLLPQRVFWLDPSTGEYAEATAPPVSFRVRVNPSLGTGAFGGTAALLRLGAALTGLALLVWLALRLRRFLVARRAQRARVQRTADERAAFSELRRAAHAGRDGSTLTALYRWLRFVAVGSPTLDALRKRAASVSISDSTQALEQRVATGKGSGRSDDVVAPLQAYRKSSRENVGRRARLPGLNAR